jgi:DNA polymerase-1
MTMNCPYLVLDCDYLCHRAKHIFGDLSDKVSATGVIYGFLRDLLSLRERFFSNRFIFCWDCGLSGRKFFWPKYKENRKHKQRTEQEKEFELAFREQMYLLRDEYLPTIGFRNIFFQDECESDDLIATTCYNLSECAEEAIVIVSSDQDLYQCLRTNVCLFDPRTKKIMTEDIFRKKYGIGPKQWVLVKAIAGCHSDNIPGIPGIGEKRALQYLRGNLSAKSKVYNTIQNGWKVVLRNQPLIQLPMPGTKTMQIRADHVTQEGWNKVTKKLGMKSIRYRNIV